MYCVGCGPLLTVYKADHTDAWFTVRLAVGGHTLDQPLAPAAGYHEDEEMPRCGDVGWLTRFTTHRG